MGGLQCQRIDSISAARAAVAVVAAHTYVWVASASANANIPNPVPGMILGAAGVDLFFVISGFIMVYTTMHDETRHGAAGRFFVRRIVRIAPLYWLAMAAMALLWRDLGTNMEREGHNLSSIVASALFVFHARPGGAPCTPSPNNSEKQCKHT